MILNKTVFDFTRPYIMGIINVTPDSFSDGGVYNTPDSALKHIETLINQGADIIDIGAESSRPGAESVSAEEEIKRLGPVLKKYSRYFSTPLSLDTYKAEVAEFGLSYGVDMINDISGLNADESMPAIIKKYDVPVVLMHMSGTPKTMQKAPRYTDVVTEIKNKLQQSINIAQANNITQLIIDPGIGFGKTLQHNLTLINHLDEFQELGFPILIGTSRKSMFAMIMDQNKPKSPSHQNPGVSETKITASGIQGTVSDSPCIPQRLGGTIASVILSIQKGANIVRVHDVGPVYEAVRFLQAVEGERV
ncbi:dihydropteroate synthase [Thermoproteota archaeon]